MPSLSLRDQNIANRASPFRVIQELQRMRKGYFRQRRWMSKNNRYSVNCVEKIKEDVANNSIVDKYLAEYIAISAILHCSDGWSLLGRAIDCHNKGDISAALHLAYYAELRGAMSLLASEGIGIFSGDHFVLDLNGRCVKIPSHQGTHSIIWPVLDHWANKQSSVDLLKKVIKPFGIELEFWINAFQPANGFRAIGTDWLKNWGLDLQSYSLDHNARNEVSYRPFHIAGCPPNTVIDSWKYLRDFWDMFEPSGFGTFSTLDQYLLRMSLASIFKSTQNLSYRQAKNKFKTQVIQMINTVSPTINRNTLTNFLSFEGDPEQPLLLSMSLGNANAHDSRGHLQVTSRAALLLRVATGACEQLLNQSSIRKKDISFWWSKMGENAGIWETDTPPSSFIDLWADIEEALKEINKWENAITTGGATDASWHHWKNQLNISPSISLLGSCERIALWGLIA